MMQIRRRTSLATWLGLPILALVLAQSGPARAGSDDFEYGRRLAQNRFFRLARKVYEGMLADPAGSLLSPEYDDWIEIYNASTNTIDLGGYYLTDNLGNKTQYRVPSNGQYVIQPGGFLLVWADNQTNQNSAEQTDLHVNFQLARTGEDPRKLARRVPDLGRIEPDAVDLAEVRRGLFERGESFLLGEVAQEAHDEPVGNSELGFGVSQRSLDPAQHRLERHPAFGVALRIEENLDVADIVGVGALEVGPGQVIKVLLGLEDAHPLVIDVEEILEVGEGVGRAHLLRRLERNRHPVALGEREQHLGLERALDVEVELGLGQAGDQRIAFGGGHVRRR